MPEIDETKLVEDSAHDRAKSGTPRVSPLAYLKVDGKIAIPLCQRTPG